ncbi:uncharacterized protein LOC131644124 [Vicia villosa]|uniref:uncharacterized protein LOC131644124 n=1 Tax=Vicia villosa TaxID=3911 RepID=UPI00273C6F45|nr:uncharacterized protein LOC131644124 [Vicia villosa]
MEGYKLASPTNAANLVVGRRTSGSCMCSFELEGKVDHVAIMTCSTSQSPLLLMISCHLYKKMTRPKVCRSEKKPGSILLASWVNSMWWKELGIKDKLTLARVRLTECSLWTVGIFLVDCRLVFFKCGKGLINSWIFLYRFTCFVRV